jgi:hypothetical protein
MQPTSVIFQIPDFTDADGVVYSDIEITVEMNSGIGDTVKLVDALQRPLTERHE